MQVELVRDPKKYRSLMPRVRLAEALGEFEEQVNRVVLPVLLASTSPMKWPSEWPPELLPICFVLVHGQ